MCEGTDAGKESKIDSSLMRGIAASSQGQAYLFLADAVSRQTCAWLTP
ncbi:MAG: hypothetical protein ACLR0F_10520 [Eisenbergiella sp.]